jgi:hypothetical protein
VRFLSIIALLLFTVISTLVGALQISSAVQNFKKKKYFIFGVDIITAIMYVAITIKIIVGV